VFSDTDPPDTSQVDDAVTSNANTAMGNAAAASATAPGYYGLGSLAAPSNPYASAYEPSNP
jgi:hypothetical protein